MPEYRREDDSEAARRQRREALEAAHERELDEWDAMVTQAHAITHRARTLATQLSLGMASPHEVQTFLAEPHSPEAFAYADLSALQTQCMLMGLDPGTGRPI